MRNFYRSISLACLASALCHPAVAAAQQNAIRPPLPSSDDAGNNRDVLTDVIIVTAARQDETQDTLAQPEQIALAPDAVTIAARAPGAGAIGNGALSGQLSYRGLFGERVLGRINGQRFASGGPNAMDPPLHYAPSILLDRIEISRGVAPVSQGPSLAGAVNAVLLQTEFTNSSDLAPQASFAAQYRSVDDSYAVGGKAGVSNENWRLGVIGSHEEGQDYRFPGGTAGGTAFQRDLYGVQAGYRIEPGELFVEYRRSETNPTGNPPFALDIVYFNTDFIQGGFRGDIADNVHLDLRLGQVHVSHLMDNQTVRRPAAPAMMARATFAQADTTTAEMALRFGSEQRHIALGADLEQVDKWVRITNPANPAFFLDAQPNLGSQRIGGFAQWRGGFGGVEFELGSRIDRTRQDAGIPQLGSAVPAGPVMLANAFIASARQRSDTTVDAVLRSWIPLGTLTPRLTLARKVRVPSLLERFAWLPTEASYGLADGNIYVGNQSLAPETAYSAEAGFDYVTDNFQIRPTIYYRRVDNYIQGTPFDATPGIIDTPVEMVSNMNGDPTPLMFRNVDAELYGADLDFLARPLGRLEIEGTASVVRGKRRDIADNLYRLSPASLRMSVSWRGDGFAFGGEMLAAARQDKISTTNSETASAGYGVFGLFGQLRLPRNIRVEAGVENLFDTYYQPHLSGLNRVGDSDVGIGERLPGPGRGVWVRFAAGF